MSKVTVFIPAFNVAEFLDQTIESVIKQTFSDWSILIIDDQSTDNTYQVALKWSHRDKRITVLRNEVNLGMLENWNKGVGLSTSPFFVKLDADDIWHPEMLASAIEVLENNQDVGLVFSKYVNIDQTGKLIENSEQDLPLFARDKPISCIPIVKEGADKFLSYPILRQGLSVMRREVFDKVGLYRFLLTKETQASTDTEFYFRVGAHYNIYCINKTLYYYRIHSNSISAIDTQNLLSAKKIFETKYCIIKYYAEMNLINSKEANISLKRITEDYNFAQIAAFRKANNWPSFIKVFITQLTHFPFSTLKFYFGRIASKI